MFDAFDRMIVNLQQMLDELRFELKLDLSLEDLYCARACCGEDIAGFLDSAVRHLLQAESERLSYVLQAQEVRFAEDLLRGVFEQLKAQQTMAWALALPVESEESFSFGCGADSIDGLSALEDVVTDEARYRVARRGATVFVEIDHDSETNFFTDLSFEISRGGLFVATYDVLSEGTPLNVFLSLPCGRSFPLQGSVSWVREFESCAEGASPGMGITFKQLTMEHTSAISRYMTERPPLFFEMA
jgi:uncharacterized protein (TIGR02266 family)